MGLATAVEAMEELLAKYWMPLVGGGTGGFLVKLFWDVSRKVSEPLVLCRGWWSCSSPWKPAVGRGRRPIIRATKPTLNRHARNFAADGICFGGRRPRWHALAQCRRTSALAGHGCCWP